MIRHLVLFRLNEGVERDDPRVVAGAEAFRALGGQIEELRFWECGWNISDRPIAYDFAINSAVEDSDALKRYLEHPAHQAGVALWREFATRAIADSACSCSRAKTAPPFRRGAFLCSMPELVIVWPQHGVMPCLHTVHTSWDAMTTFAGRLSDEEVAVTVSASTAPPREGAAAPAC